MLVFLELDGLGEIRSKLGHEEPVFPHPLSSDWTRCPASHHTHDAFVLASDLLSVGLVIDSGPSPDLLVQ